MKKFVTLLVAMVMVLAMSMSVSASAVEPAMGTGTEEDPYVYYDMPDVISVAAGETVYCGVYQIGGMILTINSSDVSVYHNGDDYVAVDGVVELDLVADGWGPVNFAITNNGEADAEYELNFSYPVGSMMNPELIDELGQVSASLEEGNTDGYFFTWTAVEDGVLTYVLDTVTEGVVCDVCLTNQNTYMSETLWGYDEEWNYVMKESVSIEVNKGDLITVQLVVLPDDNWNVAAADISAVGAFVAAEGTAMNPIQVARPADMPTSVDVAAGKAVYYNLSDALTGMILTVKGDNAYVVVVGETTDTTYKAVDGVVTVQLPEDALSVMIATGNNGVKDATYEVELSYPEGHWMNPIYVPMANALPKNVTLDVNDSVYYSVDGLRMADAIITIKGEGLYVLNGDDVVEVKDGVATVEVVGGLAPTNFAVVNAGTEKATYTMEVSYPAGHINNPIYVAMPAAVPENVTLAAGKDAHFSISPALVGGEITIKGAGLWVSVNGEMVEVENDEYTVVVTDNLNNTAVVVANTGAEEATYTFEVVFPAGHINNPVYISKPADVPASVEMEAAEEIWYNISNKLAGVVVTIEGKDLFVLVNDEPVEAVDGVVSVVVADGQNDTKVLVVNEGEEKATVKMEVGYPVGNVNNPLHLERPASMDEKVALEAGEEFWYSFGMAFEAATLTVKGENAVVVVNGEVYEAKDGVVEVALPEDVQNIVVGFVNEGSEAVEYTVSLAMPDPDTGDTFNMIPALMMVFAAVAFVVVSKKRQAI